MLLRRLTDGPLVVISLHLQKKYIKVPYMNIQLFIYSMDYGNKLSKNMMSLSIDKFFWKWRDYIKIKRYC